MTHDAEERVRAYLAAYEDECSIRRNVPAHGLLSAMNTTNHGQQGLLAADLLAVLRELDGAQAVARAYVQRESADAAGSYALRAETAEAERDDLRAKLTAATRTAAAASQVAHERDEARDIARILVHQHIGIHDATIECEVHLNLDALPGWLTAELPQHAQERPETAPGAHGSPAASAGASNPPAGAQQARKDHGSET